MRRRNLLAAGISILLLIGLLALMLFMAFSNLLLGFDIVDRLVFGGLNIVIWLAISILAIPVVIFVIITIIWLVMEARQATRDPERRWRFSRKPQLERADATGQYGPNQEPTEGRDEGPENG